MKKFKLFVTLIFIGFVTTNVNAQDFIELLNGTTSDAATFDYFGHSVAVSGNKAIIGAYSDDDVASGSGSAYIFEMINGVWTETQKITASDAESSDNFGHSVSIFGNRVVVGAFKSDDAGTYSNSGSAYVFDLNTTTGIWEETHKILASDDGSGDQFGQAVDVEGDRIVISADQEDANGINASGSVYIYDFNGTSWVETQKLIPTTQYTYGNFGKSVSLSGNRIIVGSSGDDEQANGAGAAFIFDYNGATWDETQKIVASDAISGDQFGYSVSLSGDNAIIGAYQNDALGSNVGSAYIFELNTTWTETVLLHPSDATGVSYFGNAVSISGDVAVIGAKNSTSSTGFAYIVINDGSTWSQTQLISASDAASYDEFGTAVSIDNNNLIIGASKADGLADDLSTSGSAYFFKGCEEITGTDVQTVCDSLVWIDGITYYADNNTATFNIIGGADGCDSLVTLDLTVNYSTTGTDVKVVCDSLVWIDGITYYENNNTATFNLVDQAASGCDSLVTLDLTVNTADVNVIALDPILTSTADDAAYLWLDCNNNNQPLVDETNQNLIAEMNGNFAVQITQNGCVDTSACYSIITIEEDNSGINEADLIFGNVSIYPNPINGDELNIALGDLQNVSINLFDVSGKLIYHTENVNSTMHKIELNEEAGAYFVELSAEGNTKQYKLIKL